MAKCRFCKKDIERAEFAKMVTCVRDKATGDLSYNIPSEGKKATGQIVWVAHYKHFKVAEKRENRGGDAVTGRGMGAVPTAYEIGKLTANQDELRLLGLSEEEARSMNTRELSERVAASRRQAIEHGTGDGDWREKERARAEQQGGPYRHDHVARVESFRLGAHLRWAHGVEGADELPPEERLRVHSESHAKQSLAATQQSRAEDPGHTDTELGSSDWRDQTVIEVGDVDLPVPTTEA